MKIRIKRHKESTSLRDFREENFIDMLELSIKPEALLKIMSNCPNVILPHHPTPNRRTVHNLEYIVVIDGFSS